MLQYLNVEALSSSNKTDEREIPQSLMRSICISFSIMFSNYHRSRMRIHGLHFAGVKDVGLLVWRLLGHGISGDSFRNIDLQGKLLEFKI